MVEHGSLLFEEYWTGKLSPMERVCGLCCKLRQISRLFSFWVIFSIIFHLAIFGLLVRSQSLRNSHTGKGDGIGPYIAKEARRVLEFMLQEEVKSGKVVIGDIEGLTIENRAACLKPIPDDVLAEIKKYHVTLKGPTTGTSTS